MEKPILNTEASIYARIKFGGPFRIAPSVTKLNINASHAGIVRHCECVAEALQENASIINLTISVQYDADAARLISALKYSNSLQSLCVLNHSKVVLDAIGALLEINSNIKSLSIAGFGGNSEIPLSFLQALERNNSLAALRVSINADVNYHALAKDYTSLMAALNANKTIKSVSLRKNDTNVPILDEQAFLKDPVAFKVIIKRLETIKSASEVLIRNNFWEELSQLIKDTCAKQIIDEIYPNELNLNSKAFVDQLAVHSLSNLFDDTHKETLELDSSLHISNNQRQLLLIQRDELRKQLERVEISLGNIELKINTDSETLHNKNQVKQYLQANLKTFLESFEKTQKQLKDWQQKLQMDISEWSFEDVLFLISDIGLSMYKQAFLDNKIDGAVLQALDTIEFTTMLKVSFKDAKKILMYRYLIETYRDIYAIPTGVLQWNNDTVCTWLEDNKFGHLVDVFKNNQITGAELAFLEKADLTTHLKIQTLSDVVKLQKEITKLKDSFVNQQDLQDRMQNNNQNLNNSSLSHQLEEMKRFNEELKLALKATKTKIPEAFICPITQDMMTDPVVASDGHTYERTAISLWLQNNNSSPMTGLQLSNKQLTPSHTLKSMIREFIDTNKKK